MNFLGVLNLFQIQFLLQFCSENLHEENDEKLSNAFVNVVATSVAVNNPQRENILFAFVSSIIEVFVLENYEEL